MAKTNAFNTPNGWIEVICGPMFAGKSEELLRRLNRLKYADVDFILFKPRIDTRTKGVAKSRDGRTHHAVAVHNSTEILDLVTKKYKDVSVIAIDEANFFDASLADVCEILANQGHIIYAAGLDLDFKNEPFPAVMRLMAFAEKVTKLTAICTECGAPGTRSQRLINGEPAPWDDKTIVVGDSEQYTARCRHHHIVKNKPNKFK